jgi:hypothetical protein
MSAVDVQRRHGRGRPSARRRGSLAGRPVPDAAERLFTPETSGREVPVELPGGGQPWTDDEGAAGGHGDGMTLAELVGSLWGEVLTEGRATCPLCGGEFVGRASPHARPTEGRCGDCGTTID